MFFLSGVADEEIAFHTNGKTFIESAERGFKIFPICGIEQEDAEPVKALYFMWHKKLEAKRLKIEKEKIEGKLSGYKDKSIKAIGTITSACCRTGFPLRSKPAANAGVKVHE